eukprot:CAMPEP_0178375388 /NCGR_PEP_ID=MMETSP0689_2-20121128/2861_1 /TAXON_ID=160604 /ORGANISM="Amphidinium massartii, Strain CS-259" /LENGTH=91 /DNA_ID=CAMNT_0019995377 /DNA_START=567 /DNA_END=842 /DNA_ORIENTATION=+
MPKAMAMATKRIILWNLLRTDTEAASAPTMPATHTITTTAGMYSRQNAAKKAMTMKTRNGTIASRATLTAGVSPAAAASASLCLSALSALA